jgi:hypothetical protein
VRYSNLSKPGSKSPVQRIEDTESYVKRKAVDCDALNGFGFVPFYEFLYPSSMFDRIEERNVTTIHAHACLNVEDGEAAPIVN